MFCRYCGKEIESQIVYCPYCGNLVKQGTLLKKNKSKTYVVIAFMVIVIILFIAFFALNFKTIGLLRGNFTIQNEYGDILISAKDIKSAYVDVATREYNEDEYVIIIEFTKKGAEKWTNITSQYLHNSVYMFIGDECFYNQIIMSIDHTQDMSIKIGDKELAELYLDRIYGR